MKTKIVPTSNIVKFLNALDALQNRGVEEGMGVLTGEPGEGKSTTIAYVINRGSGLFIRASATWTMTTLLGALMREVGREPRHFRNPMMEVLVEELSPQPLPIFVDEADYLFRQSEMLDVLRDLYDLTGCPVVFVGDERMARRMRTNERFGRFKRRITQWAHFEGLSLEDTCKVAEELCEVSVGEDLLKRVHADSQGNIGRIVFELSRAENLCKSNDLGSIDEDTYQEAMVQARRQGGMHRPSSTSGVA